MINGYQSLPTPSPEQHYEKKYMSFYISFTIFYYFTLSSLFYLVSKQKGNVSKLVKLSMG